MHIHKQTYIYIYTNNVRKNHFLYFWVFNKHNLKLKLNTEDDELINMINQTVLGSILVRNKVVPW